MSYYMSKQFKIDILDIISHRTLVLYKYWLQVGMCYKLADMQMVGTEWSMTGMGHNNSVSYMKECLLEVSKPYTLVHN